MNLERIIAVRNNKIVYRDGDLCIKVFDSGFSKADILNEALNQARAEETGINIPKLLEVTVIDGKWSIVSEYIKGKTLEQLSLENPEKDEEYLKLFVELQIDMQKRECRLPWRVKDKMNTKIGMAELSAELKHKLYNTLNKMHECGELCHGDFDFSNIIITPEGVPYILDWAHAARGDAAFDAAKTYLLLQYQRDTNDAEKYLDLFLRQSGMEKSKVKEWIPIAAASATIGTNADKRKFFSDCVKKQLCRTKK